MKSNTHTLKIELHILQNFPPANLNRDDNNMPKDAYYGGWRRSRVSSQSWKRAIRTSAEFNSRVSSVLDKPDLSVRTKLCAGEISRLLQSKHNRDEKNSADLAWRFTDVVFGGMDTKNLDRGKLLVYIAEKHIAEMSDMLNERWDEIIEQLNEKAKAAEASTVASNDAAPANKKEEKQKQEAIEKEKFDQLIAILENIIEKYKNDADSKDIREKIEKLGAIKDKTTKPVTKDFQKARGSLVKGINGITNKQNNTDEEGNDEEGSEEASLSILEELTEAAAKYGEPDEAITAIMKKLKKEIAKKYESRAGTVDIGLFGRMLTSLPEINIDAACQVAHVISTNKLKSEFDFFTAVDDLNTSDSGAGMMGLAGYNSNCYYRYIVLDPKQLADNLGYRNTGLQNEERETIIGIAISGIEAFLYAAIEAIPSGKQNTFAAHPRPAFVLAVVRNDAAPMSLVNAFEKPIQPDEERSLMDNSIIALNKHWQDLNKMYGKVSDENIFVGVLGGIEQMSELGKGKELALAKYVQEADEDNSDTAFLIEKVLDRVRTLWVNNNESSREQE